MTIIKNILITVLGLIIFSIGLLYLSGYGYIVTSFQRTYMAGNITANINDRNEFSTKTIKTSDSSPLLKHQNYNAKPLPAEFIKSLNATDSAAFLVIKDGKILSETYMNGYHDRSKTNSFSMAKTITTMLLGIAIEEGYVRDLDQPIVDFLPEFKNDPLAVNATVRQLALMNSGYDWDERYYSPFSPTVELYYGDDVKEFVLNGTFNEAPGSFWEYSSASTELLGIFLLRALQKSGAAMSLSEYLSNKIWRPMQMNDDALWHTDEEGMELVYCCINTNARNFAKLGLLMLNSGEWKGKQIIPAEFVREMTKPEGQEFYGLSTWLGLDHTTPFYCFSGHLGQFIIVIPDQNMVVVHLGEKPKQGADFLKETVPEYIQSAMSLSMN